jgi:hypothetical protein
VSARFVVEWIVPILGTATLLAVLFLARTPERLEVAWRRGALPWFLATRVLYLVVLHGALAVPLASDLGPLASYTRQASWGVPGLDFNHPYAPGFPWMLWLARYAVPGAPEWGLLLLFVVADAGIVVLGKRAAVAALGTTAGLRVGLFLLLDPISWQQIVARGQDEPLFLVPLVAATFLATRRRGTDAGIVLGLGLLVTKATLAPYAAAVALGGFEGRERWRAIAAMLLVAGAGYVGAQLVGMRPLHHLLGKAAHTHNFGAGVSLADRVVQHAPGIPRLALLGAFAAAVAVATARSSVFGRSPGGAAGAFRALALVHATTILFMPFCVGPYVAQGHPGALALFLPLFLVRPSATAAVLSLAALHLLACLYLTKAPYLGPTFKAACVLVYAGVAVAAWRRPEAPERDGLPPAAVPA